MSTNFDPWLGVAPPERLDSLYEQIGDLLDKIDAAESNSEEGSWRKILAFDKLPRVSRSLSWRECSASEIDRTSTMLSGPLYTSPTNPWPRLTSVKTGMETTADGYCEPLFQLDMALASQVSGYQFPSGLVQVWMNDSHATVRFVPDEVVKCEQPSPVGGEVLEFFSRGKPSERITYRTCSDGGLVAPWFESAFTFSSLGPPVHEFPDTLERFLEDLEWQNLKIAEDELETFQVIASDLHSALVKFDHCRLGRARVPSQAKQLTIGSMFGRYSSIQGGSYDAFDVPALPILDLSSSNDVFSFGDGTAQLLTPANAPASSFKFEWTMS